MRLRNIGGMIIIDFIDMLSRADKLAIMEEMELALEPDKAKPQVGQLSDLGLVELTRHRQGQSLSEIFTKKCPHCQGSGYFMNEFNFATPTAEAEMKAKVAKAKMPIATFNKKSNKNNQRQQETTTENTVENLETVAEDTLNVEENNFDRKNKKNRRNKFNKRNKNNRFQNENVSEAEASAETLPVEPEPQPVMEAPVETVSEAAPEAVVEEPKKKTARRTRKSSKTKEEPAPEAVVVETPAVENAEQPAFEVEEKPKRRPNRGSSRAARKTKAKKTEDET